MLRAFAPLLASAFILFPPFASAAPRIAIVRVGEIYRDLVSTKTMNEELEKERQTIIKDERAVHLRKILTEMKELYDELAKKRGAPMDDATRKLAQNFEQKRQESQTLQHEFQLFETEKKKEINRKMVEAMRASLEKISAATVKVAGERGYDATFDISGNSNTGVPILLYAKQPEDITEQVVAVLKDSGEPSVTSATDTPAGPAPTPETPAAAPAKP